MSNIIHPKIIGSEHHMPGVWGQCDITECHTVRNAEEARKCIAQNGCNTHNNGDWKIGWCPNDGSIRSWNSRHNTLNCNLLPDTVNTQGSPSRTVLGYVDGEDAAQKVAVVCSGSKTLQSAQQCARKMKVGNSGNMEIVWCPSSLVFYEPQGQNNPCPPPTTENYHEKGPVCDPYLIPNPCFYGVL